MPDQDSENQRLKAESFQAAIGEEFDLKTETKAIPVELLEVNIQQKIEVGGQAIEPFSVAFRAPAGCQLQQGIYELTHTDLGSVSLFLVPYASDDSGYYLNATVS
jgi:hypothetical protein